MRPISSLDQDVVDLGVTSLKTPTGGSTGRFRIAWLDGAGIVQTSKSSHVADPVWWAPKKVATFPADGSTSPSAPALDGSWVALHAYDTSNGEIEIGVPLG